MLIHPKNNWKIPKGNKSKDRQYNDQWKKDKRENNDLQNTT
jgi:hypothetical protein